MDEAAGMAIDALGAHLPGGLQHEVAEEMLDLEREQRPQGQSRLVAHPNPFRVLARD